MRQSAKDSPAFQRHVLLIGGVLSLALVGPCAAEDPAPGAGVWAESCNRCHRGGTESIAYALPAPDDAAGKDRLDRFLAMHHTTDAASRAALVDWLADQSSQ